MTKKKLHESVLALCTEHQAKQPLIDALSELTKPKVGGGSDVNDYTCFGEDGSVEFIFCAYHKKWEPVTAIQETEEGESEFTLFKVDEKAKNGYFRSCIDGDKQWREQAKVFNASKGAIMTDVLDEKLSGAEAKAAIAELDTARQVHTAREDGLGAEAKPCDEEATAETEEV